MLGSIIARRAELIQSVLPNIFRTPHFVFKPYTHLKESDAPTQVQAVPISWAVLRVSMFPMQEAHIQSPLALLEGGLMSDFSNTREYYHHDPECVPADLGPLTPLGVKACRGCLGVFNSDGTGVALTSTIFDKDHPDNVVLGEE
jgi:hypothetical protein